MCLRVTSFPNGHNLEFIGFGQSEVFLLGSNLGIHFDSRLVLDERLNLGK